MENCCICPRECGANRSGGETGFCGETDVIRIGRAALHKWEEPCISGANGSGAVFFSGCSVRCRFCQNREISAGGIGRRLSSEELANELFRLRDEGAHNINLVTGDHFIPQLAELLQRIKPQLKIPVIFNCGGYEKSETLRLLDGLADVYLPDIKFCSSELSEAFASAPDYFDVACKAVEEMFRQVGGVRLDSSGMIEKGLIIRHLVLPSHSDDSLRIVNHIAEQYGGSGVMISLMSQYCPIGKDDKYKELNRRVYSYEYDKVCRAAAEAGLDGFTQERSAADVSFIPDFTGE